MKSLKQIYEQVNEPIEIAKLIPDLRYDGVLIGSSEPHQYTYLANGPAKGMSFYMKDHSTVEDVKKRLAEKIAEFEAGKKENN